MAQLPLAGIRVLDFTWVLAGPVATRILAALGAEVIKVERKSGYIAPRTGVHGDLNRDKLSIALNMSAPGAIEVAHRVVKISDLVIDNFSARVMRQWRMDYESLVKIKPDIICLSMSGFGHTGPRADYVSFGPTLQAFTGFTLNMADEKGRPAGFSYSYSDSAAGYTGAMAALFALWHRRRTGRGQFIDFAQFEGLVSLVGPSMLDMTANARPQRPQGWRSQEGPAAPHGAYRCRPRGDDDDRWLVIAARTHEEWTRLVRALGSPAWASQPQFATLYMRMRNRGELDAHIGRWTAGQQAEAAMSTLQSAGVPAGLIANAQDCCALDPQLAERGFWPALSLPEGGETKVCGIPFKLSGTPVGVRRHSSIAGESNDYVFGDLLGLSRGERDDLIEKKILWP
ncbi:MAG TPA: CoA transferase [Candidatus Binataceae bacterium]|nr:CoA transferase [Candidatus Binataceae bacterium]